MKQFKRTLSVVLSAAMILQTGITPVMAQAQPRATVGKTITAFAVLPEDKANIILPLGSTEAQVLAALPDTLTATLATTTVPDSGAPPAHKDELTDSGTPPTEDEISHKDELTDSGTIPTEDADIDSGNQEGVISPGSQPVPVTWVLAEDAVFSSETPGAFIYTARLSDSDYTLAEGVSLPEINVMVGAMPMLMTTGTICHVDTTYTGTDSDGTEAKPYTTIDAALTAIGSTDGCTLKPMSDVDLGNERVVIGDISLTLELNGKTLTSTNTNATMQYNGTTGKTLTVQDSGTGGRIENSGSGYAIANSTTTCTVNVTGGTVASRTGTAINNGGALNLSGGTVSTTTGTAIKNYSSSSTLNVSGGTVIHEANGNAIYNIGTSTVTFTGGLIWGNCSKVGSSTIPEGMAWSVKGAQTLSVNVTLPEGTTFTVPSGSALTILKGDTLTNNGTITNNGVLKLYGTLDGTGTLGGSGSFITFGAEDITIPPYYYNGNQISAPPQLAPSRTVMGKAFTVSQGGYTGPGYANNTEVGEATVTYVYLADRSLTIEKKFNIVQSGTTFNGGIILDKTHYTYGEIITATVTPKATGEAPRTRALTPPTTGQMALFLGDTQISAAVSIVGGKYTMTYDTADKILPIGQNSITAKFVGNTNMADYSESVTVTLNPRLVSSHTINATKVYNGTDFFTGIVLTPTAGDILSGDSITATAKGVTASATVGTHSFTVTGVDFSGEGKDFYSPQILSGFSGSVTITQAPLTVSGGTATKKWDNNTIAKVTALTFNGLQNGETLAITTDYTMGTPNYDNSNVGTGKAVTGTVALTASTKASNYTLTGAYSITGEITLANGSIAPLYFAMNDTLGTDTYRAC